MSIDIFIEELSVFILVFCRVVGLIIFNPLFSRSNVPSQMRLGLVLGLTILIAQPFTLDDLPSFTDFSFVILMLMELSFGLVAGYVFQFFYFMLFAAGDIIDMGIGLSMAKAFDPGTNLQVSVSGNIFQIMYVVYFFATDSHLTLIKLVALSYDYIGLGLMRFNIDVVSFMISLFSTTFLLAIQLVLPFAAASFTLEMSMGILMKLIPQINVFVINFQFKVLLGIILLLLYATAVSEYLLGHMDTMLKTIVELFYIM